MKVTLSQPAKGIGEKLETSFIKIRPLGSFWACPPSLFEGLEGHHGRELPVRGFSALIGTPERQPPVGTRKAEV